VKKLPRGRRGGRIRHYFGRLRRFRHRRGHGKSVNLKQAFISGFLGYVIPKLVAYSGLGWIVYDYVPYWKYMTDGQYAHFQNWTWSYGGAGGLTELAATGLSGLEAYRAVKGKLDSRDFSSAIPLILGLWLGSQ
jgi:hypothetical protein